jgi:hypothetical protein
VSAPGGPQREEALAVPPHAQSEQIWPGARNLWEQRPGHALVSAQQGAQLARPPERAPGLNEQEQEEPGEVLELRVRLERRPAVS